MSITIRKAIEALELAATKSSLGDQAVLHLCELDREFVVIEDVGIDVDPNGATALVSLHKLSESSSCLTHDNGSKVVGYKTRLFFAKDKACKSIS